MEGRHQRGFTLLELLFVLMTIALLATLAVPAWQDMVSRFRVGTWQRQLHGALYYTRSHAIFHATSTVICARGPDGGCADSGGSWANGWLVFEDPEGNRDCEPDAQGHRCANSGRRILRINEGTEAVQIVNNNNVARRVRYGTQGLSPGYTGRFTICPDAEGVEASGLVIANTGRIRSARPGERLSCRQP